MQSTKAIFVLLVLAACAPAVPDSGAGVGFGDYSDYVRQRDTQADGVPLDAVPQSPTTFSTESVGAALDNAENGTGLPTGRVIGQGPVATGATRPRGNAPAGIRQETGEMRSNGISDEQSFDAVAGRETVESDAQRLANQRAQYEVIAPTALPQRSGNIGPNIVEFALSTTHAPGTQMYKRGGLFTRDALVTCAKYASPDLAQEAFLANGGPARDREGLDPDGDGFACGWDPRPFRTALQ
ncbi:hypothetical protein EOK75_14835 (plasmid) [Pseudorhodobacter turbinis]|uniref:Excalibur calcium-binding domain-containing protein n=1 Tax=Pseudorhodobacter turbinis TaxID=2500533 RepID=A0A4P8EIS0_9RHOB|nr:hypothetical protein [Pseudorhodobacter turbinis]QCO57060.1 hypothetical protein EOK75_14835 [Pseudorhodobacter turbinis]